jgi:uncharacterized protein with GYD domain
MATYVTLFKWTAKGVNDVKDTVTRAEKAAQVAESLGGNLRTILWTQGSYDGVVITEFPDDETQGAFVIATAMQGNITTETLRAFTAQELEAIISKLP